MAQPLVESPAARQRVDFVSASSKIALSQAAGNRQVLVLSLYSVGGEEVPSTGETTSTSGGNSRVQVLNVLGLCKI